MIPKACQKGSYLFYESVTVLTGLNEYKNTLIFFLFPYYKFNKFYL